MAQSAPMPSQPGDENLLDALDKLVWASEELGELNSRYDGELESVPVRKRARVVGGALQALTVALQAMGVSRADMCRVGVQGVTLTQPGRCSNEPIMAHALKPGNTRRAMAGSDAGVVSVQWQDAQGQAQVVRCADVRLYDWSGCLPHLATTKGLRLSDLVEWCLRLARILFPSWCTPAVNTGQTLLAVPDSAAEPTKFVPLTPEGFTAWELSIRQARSKTVATGWSAWQMKLCDMPRLDDQATRVMQAAINAWLMPRDWPGDTDVYAELSRAAGTMPGSAPRARVPPSRAYLQAASAGAPPPPQPPAASTGGGADTAAAGLLAPLHPGSAAGAGGGQGAQAGSAWAASVNVLSWLDPLCWASEHVSYLQDPAAARARKRHQILQAAQVAAVGVVEHIIYTGTGGSDEEMPMNVCSMGLASITVQGSDAAVGEEQLVALAGRGLEAVERQPAAAAASYTHIKLPVMANGRYKELRVPNTPLWEHTQGLPSLAFWPTLTLADVLVWALRLMLRVYPGYDTRRVNSGLTLVAVPSDTEHQACLHPLSAEAYSHWLAAYDEQFTKCGAVGITELEPEDGAFRVVQAASQLGVCTVPESQPLEALRQELQRQLDIDEATRRREYTPGSAGMHLSAEDRELLRESIAALEGGAAAAPRWLQDMATGGEGGAGQADEEDTDEDDEPRYDPWADLANYIQFPPAVQAQIDAARLLYAPPPADVPRRPQQRAPVDVMSEVLSAQAPPSSQQQQQQAHPSTESQQAPSSSAVQLPAQEAPAVPFHQQLQQAQRALQARGWSRREVLSMAPATAMQLAASGQRRGRLHQAGQGAGSSIGFRALAAAGGISDEVEDLALSDAATEMVFGQGADSVAVQSGPGAGVRAASVPAAPSSGAAGASSAPAAAAVPPSPPAPRPPLPAPDRKGIIRARLADLQGRTPPAYLPEDEFKCCVCYDKLDGSDNPDEPAPLLAVLPCRHVLCSEQAPSSCLQKLLQMQRKRCPFCCKPL